MIMRKASDEERIAAAVTSAWEDLYPDPERPGRDGVKTRWRGNTGGRAALRRAVSPEAVLLLPVFHEMLFAMRQAGAPLPRIGSDAGGPEDDAAYLLHRRLALMLGALAELKSPNAGKAPFSQVLGGTNPEQRLLSARRFETMVAALNRGPDADALTAMRRAMSAIGDSTFDVASFARDLLCWGRTPRPPVIHWIYGYHGQSTGLDAEATPQKLEEPAP